MIPTPLVHYPRLHEDGRPEVAPRCAVEDWWLITPRWSKVTCPDCLTGDRVSPDPATCRTAGCERSVDTYVSHGKCCLTCGTTSFPDEHLAYCRRRHAASDASGRVNNVLTQNT